MNERVEIFCCYAHEDRSYLLKLKKQLTPLLRRQLINNIWSDVDISPGMDWEREINKHLNTAQIILLLVSPDFIASDYCYSTEMARAIERHERGEAKVIPVILRPVSWRETPFAKLQALPAGTRPVTDWQNRDKAFRDVAEGIHRAVEERTPRHPSPASNEPLFDGRNILNATVIKTARVRPDTPGTTFPAADVYATFWAYFGPSARDGKRMFKEGLPGTNQDWDGIWERMVDDVAETLVMDTSDYVNIVTTEKDPTTGAYICIEYKKDTTPDGKHLTGIRYFFWFVTGGEPVKGGYCNLVQKATGKCLDADGSRVYMLTPNGGDFQLWRAVEASPNTIVLQHLQSGRVLDAAPERGAYLREYNNGLSQQWILEDAGDGYKKLRQVATGMLLDGGANGDAYIFEENGGDFQLWRAMNIHIASFP